MARRAGQALRGGVWGPLSTRVRSSRALRAPAVTAYRTAARVALRGSGPRVLANSVPKAGTHLLTQILGGVPGLWYSGVHLNDADFRAPGDGWTGENAFDGPRLAASLSRVGRGQFVTAHLGAAGTVGPVLASLDYRHLLLVRDPRDVAVSLAHYLAGNERHVLYESFASGLADDDERLMAAIRGRPAVDGAPLLPSIGARLRQFVGWLDEPDHRLVRFEDLVGRQGGGDDEVQYAAIGALLQHCGRPADDARIRRLAGQAFASSSATFRSGRIGGWREHFTDAHEEAFDAVAGELMPLFGYPRAGR